MTLIQQLEHWGETHHPKWMDLVRIGLGAFLCYKGIQFLENMSAFISLISEKMSFGDFILVLIGHYVVFAHILGGVFLILGILTRFACLIQIPILIGALFFINAPGRWWSYFPELTLALVSLLLLIYFLIAGNGPLSLKLEEEKAT
jgi:uncharacterized membrane protein YphA (DoxX/SURF4 family)